MWAVVVEIGALCQDDDPFKRRRCDGNWRRCHKKSCLQAGRHAHADDHCRRRDGPQPKLQSQWLWRGNQPKDGKTARWQFFGFGSCETATAVSLPCKFFRFTLDE